MNRNPKQAIDISLKYICHGMYQNELLTNNVEDDMLICKIEYFLGYRCFVREA